MFPLGILSYLAGGLLIGFGVGLIFITTGLHATQSSFFDTVLSFFSERPYFQRDEFVNSRGWRIVLASGMIFGAVLCTVIFFEGIVYTTQIQMWRLALGGFLVGFGTRLSQGCTSGHGISGLASLSTTSLYAVLTFMSVGILTAAAIHSMGVLP